MVCNYDEVLKLCGYGYECPRVRMGTDMDVHGHGWVRILLLRVRMGMGTILIPVQLSTDNSIATKSSKSVSTMRQN